MTKGSKRKLIRNLGKKRGQFGLGSQHEQQISFILISGGGGGEPINGGVSGFSGDITL
jgi:hypothetical protein